MIKETNASYAKSEVEVDAREVLVGLAQETEELAMKERQNYSPVLKKWHGTAGAVAASTLHSCYGQVLNQYLNDVTTLTSDTVEVLERANKLEKVLVHMVVEDSADCEDGGKTIVREMDPYEVDSVILNLLRKWIHDSLTKCTEVFERVRESETWNPKSKQEPYAQSAMELMKLANTAVEEFFRIPVSIPEDLVQELAVGLETLFRDYMTFVAACGSKKSYIPSLPPLTRCSRDSKLSKMWKIRNPCSYGLEQEHQTIHSSNEAHQNPQSNLPPPRPSTSRGTQRLYIRLNTLHYLLTHIHAIAKALSLHPNPRPFAATSHFEILVSSIHAACQHVSEIAAYRLIFLDSNFILYDSLYVGDMANASIGSALRILKQNLNLMLTILTEKAHVVAVKEVIKATFDAFLMVLLAGGSNRVYNRSDHQLIKEDFEGLKRLFVNCWEGLKVEDIMDKEGEVVEGVIALMGESTEQLMEDFSTLTCETSGLGVIGSGQKLPMPPTTRRWHRADPNTILRVLCHRNDKIANQFLKRTFQLAKRK
ncbi:protein unc-13 homolog [Neltuma alba]|nr:protein unc-13 homolog [Prosopis alba]